MGYGNSYGRNQKIPATFSTDPLLLLIFIKKTLQIHDRSTGFSLYILVDKYLCVLSTIIVNICAIGICNPDTAMRQRSAQAGIYRLAIALP